MTLFLDVKICGLNEASAVMAAVEGGARYVGFVFYPRSPRALDVETAKRLAVLVPDTVTLVGLFVNPTDADILHVTSAVPLGAIQLHGNETPDRVAAVKRLTGLPIIKAVGIEAAADVAAAAAYESVADFLLLDAKPALGASRPGGNAAVFNWDLLREMTLTKPWLLAGGLNVANLAQAVAATGARIVDVSSGVEDVTGRKNTDKIKEFLSLVRRL